jgi:CDP-4-dehydro-6-deoxyglucose reductase
MPTVALSSGSKFDAECGESLLDAASRSRIIMSYSCRTGRCSTCKCRVINGHSVALREELGLTRQESEKGWILSCVRTPTTDMALEVEDLGGLMLPSVKTLPCRIQALEKLATDVMKVVLRLPPSSDFSFYPGQYIDVIAQGGLRRSYSLASAPHPEKVLELHVREVPVGVMSDYWFTRAKENDLLRLTGPLGTFFLRNIGGLDLIFLATGTGIAPVKAMLESIESVQMGDCPRSITVYWGGRSPNDLYWNFSTINSAYRYVPVLSRASIDWTGMRGHVQSAMLADAPNLDESVVYACGSDAMIHGAKEVLVRAGLPERRFLSDAFVCSAVN